MIYICASAGYRSHRSYLAMATSRSFSYLSTGQEKREWPRGCSPRYSFWALLTYRLPLISYTRNIANRKRRARTVASLKIAFAYGADCPVPRVKDLARPWWLLASFVPTLRVYHHGEMSRRKARHYRPTSGERRKRTAARMKRTSKTNIWQRWFHRILTAMLPSSPSFRWLTTRSRDNYSKIRGEHESLIPPFAYLESFSLRALNDRLTCPIRTIRLKAILFLV